MILIAVIVGAALFALCMLAEWVLGRRQGLNVYAFEDSLLNLASGLGHVGIELAGKSAIYVLYVAVYGVWHAVDLPREHVATWVFGFLTAELAFYLWHRASHDASMPWATHAPHHQSREFNLSVALRSSWTSKPIKLSFLLPVALVGVEPVIFLTWMVVAFVYQLFIHTRLVPSLAVVEWVFNTPSLHRVHHASNAPYLDRNHGGIVVIWDRLFGTFQREIEGVPVVFGTVSPEPDENLMALQFAPVLRAIRHASAAETWREGVARWVGSPADVVVEDVPPRQAPVAEADRFGLVAGLAAITMATGAMILWDVPAILQMTPLMALAVWGSRMAVLRESASEHLRTSDLP